MTSIARKNHAPKIASHVMSPIKATNPLAIATGLDDTVTVIGKVAVMLMLEFISFMPSIVSSSESIIG
jgi:hypothetical protein